MREITVGQRAEVTVGVFSYSPNSFLAVFGIFIRVNYINNILQRTYTHNIYLQTHTHIYI